MSLQYQWFPGHMAKAMRMMQEHIKLIDLLVEIVDARAPLSSRNPEVAKLARGKFCMILLNKADLADPGANKAWAEYFASQGISAVELDARQSKGMTEIRSRMREACREKIERDKKRGIKNRPIRAMVCGIPNVGKSTFVNSLAGRGAAKTGNKPGVTKGKQWISLEGNLELLDTPGVLWPRFEDPRAGRHLAFLGSIKDDILPVEEMAWELYQALESDYGDRIEARYGLRPQGNGEEVLGQLALARNCLAKGGGPDLARFSALLVEDFRSGRLGRISLERPETGPAGERV